MSVRWPPGQWGLTARIVALSLLLLLLVQAAVFSVVRLSMEQSAQRQVTQELMVGERLWRRLLDQNAQKLGHGASLLAADYGFREAVNSQDVDTIRSVLENHGARIGATVTALLDTSMALRAVGEGQDESQIEPLLKRLAGVSAQQALGSQVALVGRVPYQFVLVHSKPCRFSY